MSSAIVQLLVFGVPSYLYTRRLRRSGGDRQQALRAIGLQGGPRRAYLLALVLIPCGSAVAILLLQLVPSGVLQGSENIVATSTTVTSLATIVVRALAEEILFRGFIAGLLFRRYGFQTGNAIQAAVFLAPHLLLLLVDPHLWPILPLQLVAGWALGWLRYRSNSIGPGWLAHSGVNLVAALLLAG